MCDVIFGRPLIIFSPAKNPNFRRILKGKKRFLEDPPCPGPGWTEGKKGRRRRDPFLYFFFLSTTFQFSSHPTQSTLATWWNSQLSPSYYWSQMVILIEGMTNSWLYNPTVTNNDLKKISYNELGYTNLGYNYNIRFFSLYILLN